MNDIKRMKFNVCLLGEGKVGKTCITSRKTGQPFDENTLMTVGMENFLDAAKFDGVEYKFKIFDTAGQERYRSISTSTIQLSEGFLLVFAVNDKKSFEHVEDWIKFIEDATEIEKKVLILVGNKIDIEKREVSNEEAMNFAQEKNMKYFETSAKTGFGIEETFKTLYQDVYDNFKKSEEENKKTNGDKTEENKNFELNNKHQNKEKKKKCC